MTSRNIEAVAMRPITAARVGPPTPRAQDVPVAAIGDVDDLPQYMQDEIAEFTPAPPVVSSGVMTFLTGVMTGGAVVVIASAILGVCH